MLTLFSFSVAPSNTNCVNSEFYPSHLPVDDITENADHSRSREISRFASFGRTAMEHVDAAALDQRGTKQAAVT